MVPPEPSEFTTVHCHSIGLLIISSLTYIFSNYLYLKPSLTHGTTPCIYCHLIAGKSLPGARHWADDAVFEGRAFFQSAHSPGRLVIDSVKVYDAGLYKCRVDFKIQPTTISQVNLTINSK